VSVPFLDLSRRVAALRPELDAAIAAVLDGGRFVLGEQVEGFESEFAAYCGAAHAVGVASGTDALAIALRAVGVRPGDEVVIPANTCAPTAAGVEAAGAVPVLADVDPDTWLLTAETAAAVVTPRTRALVPVHLYGLCADVDALRELGLPIVEDSAQAHGAELRGRRAGTLGDAAAFSFYPTKNLGALGDGGAVVTNDAAVAERARALRTYGERERYRSEEPGWNSRLDELQAALLRVQLPHLDAWTERRRAIAARYGGDPAPGHARHLYVVRRPDRDAFRARLAERGVETLVHYPRAVHEQPAYARFGHAGLAESERHVRECVSLPLYPELRDEEVDVVAEALA
jgi:dTDP-4-amino-4,6-dideoxygalactose transaminase